MKCLRTKRKVLTRVLELKAELLMFLQDAKCEYAYNFSDPVWLLIFNPFLADQTSNMKENFIDLAA